MISSNNPNIARSEELFPKYTHLDISTHRFIGKKSVNDQLGGIPLLYSKEKCQLAIDASDNHTLVIGATGSKKTRSIVMPTIKVLGYAGESMIINDPKGEIYQRMAGELRELEYKIIAVNLRDPSQGYAWNPLQIPYRYYKIGDIDKAAEFANDIANTLILGEIASDDPFWNYSAYDCCLGMILLLFKLCKEMNYPDHSVNISNLLRLRRKLFENGMNAKNTPLWRWASQDELIVASLTGSVMTAHDTQRGILAMLDQKLRALAIQPSLLDMLSNYNFDIAEIAKNKTAVFLITPDEKTTYSSIVAMFISQSYQHLIYSATQSNGRVPVRVNYILDEFSSLPAIGSDLPNMISAARSRNIRYLICIQSKSQLIKRYKEEADTIISNCANWVVLFTRELDLLREVSELCGQKKDHTPNISVFDLQHLSKDKNEALLLAGKEKPCLVTLLDIDHFGERNYRVIDFFTPERQLRFNIDFSNLPSGAEEFSGEDRNRFMTICNPSNIPFNNEDTVSSTNAKLSNQHSSNNLQFDVDALLTRIDEKIAELEEEEKENAISSDRLKAVIETIETRRNELYHSGNIIMPEN